jgi:hypothetical protein
MCSRRAFQLCPALPAAYQQPSPSMQPLPPLIHGVLQTLQALQTIPDEL